MTTPPPIPAQQYAWRPPPPPPPVAPNGQPLAEFTDRLLAHLIDYAIQFVVSLLLVVPFMIWWISTMVDWMRRATEAQRDFDPDDPYSTQPMPDEVFVDVIEIYLWMFLFIAAVMVLGLLFTYLYFVEYQLRRGGETVGKRVMKIKVIPVQPNQPLTRLDLVKRWGVQWVVNMFVPLFTYLDGLWQLWDKPLRQCLHDKAAATVVVKVG